MTEPEDKTYYQSGQHACLDGFEHHMNPYTGKKARQLWSSGWANPRLAFEDYMKQRAGE